MPRAYMRATLLIADVPHLVFAHQADGYGPFRRAQSRREPLPTFEEADSGDVRQS